MFSLVWPKLCLCCQQTQDFISKIICCWSEPHCPEGFALQGVVLPGRGRKARGCGEASLRRPSAPVSPFCPPRGFLAASSPASDPFTRCAGERVVELSLGSVTLTSWMCATSSGVAGKQAAQKLTPCDQTPERATLRQLSHRGDWPKSLLRAELAMGPPSAMRTRTVR